MAEMKKVRCCEICGGELRFSEDRLKAKCKYCDSEYYFAEEKGEALTMSLNRASYFRRKCNFYMAIAEYQTILCKFPDDEEANWGMFIAKCGIEYVKDSRTMSMIPTCHRIVKGDILSHPNYLKAIEMASEKQKEKYIDEANSILRLQKRIIKQMEEEEDYDVFISFKAKDENGKPTKDSVIARNIYDKLSQYGIKTFFSEVTLRNRMGDEFEPIIYKALYSCKQFILVTTSLEHSKAVWVRNEWARYRDRMAEERLNGTAFAVFSDPSALPGFIKGAQGFNLNNYPNGGYEIAIADYLALKLGKRESETDKIKKELEKIRSDFGQNTKIVGDFRIDKGILLEYLGDSVDVKVPDNVVEIASEAFKDCRFIKTVTIPAMLDTIGERAFVNCRNLVTINVSESVKKLAENAFEACTNLDMDSKKRINKVLYGFGSNIHDFEIVNKTLVKYNGTDSEVEIPKDISVIGAKAFSGNQTIEIVRMSSGMHEIGEYAFEGCEELKTVDVPYTVYAIRNCAFKDCFNLENIKLPSSLEILGYEAFSDCSALGELVIPHKIKKIPSRAFYHCGNLCDVKFHNDVTEIGDQAFVFTSLTELNLPKNLKIIGDGSFSYCDGLEGVTIPEGVEFIGEDAFYCCSALYYAEFPSSLKYIGDDAFTDCDNLDEETLEQIESIRESYQKEHPEVLLYKIKNGIFQSYKGNSPNVVVPNGVKEIAGSSFMGKNFIKTVKLPEGLEYIGLDAFNSCVELENINIPSTVKIIGEKAFYCCYKLDDESKKQIARVVGDNHYKLKSDTYKRCKDCSGDLIYSVDGKRAKCKLCYKDYKIVDDTVPCGECGGKIALSEDKKSVECENCKKKYNF